MKTFLKIFAIAFICFVMAMGVGLWAFNKMYEEPANAAIDKNVEVIDSHPGNMKDENKEEEDKRSELEKLIDDSKRMNVVLLGMEGPRTDTIIFASFDPESKNLDLVSIPRDTYYSRAGYSAADEKKLNAVYGDAGADGTMEAIGNILGGVPVDYYVKITYKGVQRIVDSLGGVQVNIPMDMNYDDPYDNPPLHIHFKKGTQVLNGEKAIQFLRYRKGNGGGGYPEGDLGRMKAQQAFVKVAIKKALGFRLPTVANTVFKQIKTDMALTDIMILAKNAIGMTTDNVKTYSLPGNSFQKGLSYFKHDQDGVETLMKEIYKRDNE